MAEEKQTFAEWVRQTYQSEDRQTIYDCYQETKESGLHNYSISNFDRAVRRIIRSIDGYKKPEESCDVQTLDQALEYHNVDMSAVNVKKFKVNSWGSENNKNKQVSVELVPKTAQDLSPEEQAKIFLDAIKTEFRPPKKPKAHKKVKNNLHGVISIADAHFGLENWGQALVGGKDFRVEDAKELYLDAVEFLLEKLCANGATEFSMPQIGDLLNVDNMQNSTTKGTPQYENCDPRKAYRIALETMLASIEMVAEKGKVYVPVVSGNHDYLSHDQLFQAVSLFFAKNPNVIVDDSPNIFKAYTIGDVGIMIAHGNHAKHSKQELGMKFATKFPEIWGQTKIHLVLSGHLHHSKVVTVNVDENMGVRTYILPALTPTNVWHEANFYSSRQGAIGLLVDPKVGETLQVFFNEVE